MSASLRYVNLNANGIQSIIYDAISLYQAVSSGYGRILLLGVSGDIFIPILLLFYKTRIITNIDGIEWKRKKWNWLARFFLKCSESFAIKFSHEIISDNE